jgi:hypothetical protein
MNARPHLNGNSPESFQDAGWKLHTIAKTAKTSMRDALCEITHGRNYQGVPCLTAKTARDADLARIAKINDALNDLEAMAQEIYEAGLSEQNLNPQTLADRWG